MFIINIINIIMIINIIISAPDVVQRLDFVGAGKEDDILGPKDVWTVKRLIRVYKVDQSRWMDHSVNLVQQIPD